MNNNLELYEEPKKEEDEIIHISDHDGIGNAVDNLNNESSQETFEDYLKKNPYKQTRSFTKEDWEAHMWEKWNDLFNSKEYLKQETLEEAAKKYGREQPYQELFNYLANELNVIALQTQMQEIEAIVMAKQKQINND